MKRLLTLLFLSFVTLLHAQAPKFDVVDFNQKLALADWLCRYDAVAWVTSDSLMKEPESTLRRIGPEWFCFEKDGEWHAVYGKYANNSYDMVRHYKIDNTLKVAKTDALIDTTLLHSYARALQTAMTALRSKLNPAALKFNHYIKQNEDKTFSVWIFPSFQPNRVAVYGAEFIYIIHQNGLEINKDDSFLKESLLGFDVGAPRDITLNYQEKEKPTLGSIFFVWYYKSYFTKINIDTKDMVHVPIKDKDTWSWLHIEKQSN